MNRTGKRLTGVAALSLAAAATMLGGASRASADDCLECPPPPPQKVALGSVLQKLDLISLRSDLLADKMEPAMDKVEFLFVKW